MTKVNDICKECAIWKSQGEKCWYHWELKQNCSQKIEMPDMQEKNNVSKVIN